MTVFDVMTLCEVRDSKKPLTNKQIAQKLEQLGFLEKRGKTNAVSHSCRNMGRQSGQIWIRS